MKAVKCLYISESNKIAFWDDGELEMVEGTLTKEDTFELYKVLRDYFDKGR